MFLQIIMTNTLLKIFAGLAVISLTIATKLEFVTREEWTARVPTENITAQVLPIPIVIIAHTATSECESKDRCIRRVRSIQTYHMDTREFGDIGYNFLIGGDGLVYEGRGWGKEGTHTKNHNNHSIAIAFIGTFNSTAPPRHQLQSAQFLLEEGVSIGILSSNYKLYGHRQLTATNSPGDALYDIIKSWAHWTPI